MKFANLFWSGASGDVYNRKKLANIELIEEFLKKAEGVLGIVNGNAYVLAFCPEPQAVNQKEFIIGGSIAPRASITLEISPYRGSFLYRVLSEHPLPDDVRQKLYELEKTLC